MTFLRELLYRRRINRLTEIQRRLDELGSWIKVSQACCAETPTLLVCDDFLWIYHDFIKERDALVKEQHRLRRKMI